MNLEEAREIANDIRDKLGFGSLGEAAGILEARVSELQPEVERLQSLGVETNTLWRNDHVELLERAEKAEADKKKLIIFANRVEACAERAFLAEHARAVLEQVKEK